MRTRNAACTALAVASLAGAAHAGNPGDVIISEIFYATNQGASAEQVQEFIEIYNTTGAPIDISGWYFLDNTPEFPEPPSSPFPDGTIIPANSAIAFCGVNFFDPGSSQDPVTGEITIGDPCINVTIEKFREAWSTADSTNSIQIFNITSLSNSPNLINNEIYELRDETDQVIDVVNYDDTAPWPSDAEQGFSIYVLPQFLNATDNDNAAAWRNSAVGVNGAVTTPEVLAEGLPCILFPEGENVASPGFVENTFVFTDCNNNGIDDARDIFDGTSQDCNTNGIPDECEPDCDNDGTPDGCQIATDPATLDCNNNGVLDSCDIATTPALDTNLNGIIDACETSGELIITEIFVDPASFGEDNEFVEIYNTTGAPIDVSGYVLNDLDDAFDLSDPFPAGTIVGPGEALVIIDDFSINNQDPADPLFGVDPVADFEGAWGITPGSVQIIAVPNFGSRANNGSPGDEILALQDGSGINIDVVDYDADSTPGSGWPDQDGTSSIYLIGSAAGDANAAQLNNFGSNWRLSIDGISGATTSNGSGAVSNSARDSASPGVVDLADPVSPSNAVFITEIFSVANSVLTDTGIEDPNNPGMNLMAFPQNEWVEIYNSGATPVDVSGWYLRDEDGYSGTFPAGTVLAPGEVAVVFGIDIFFNGGPFTFYGNANGARDAFYDAWGCGYQVIAIDGWNADLNTLPNSRSLRGLSNGPSDSNEILTLRDAAGGLVDLVNYDDDGTIWPADGAGDSTLESFSILLLPNELSGAANDDGLNWTTAFVPFELARNSTITDFFSGPGGMAASPGALEGASGNIQVPDLLDCPTPACSVADVNTTNTNPGDALYGQPDGGVDGADLSFYVENWLNQNAAVADVNTTNTNPGDAGYGSPDGQVDGADLSFYVEAWLAGCP